MKSKKGIFKKILILLVIVFGVIQFFRIDKTNPPVVAEMDLFSMHDASPEIKATIKSACYDCHSNETVYPWYSNIAPVSWWLKHHIDDGRKHLNFSEWGTYELKKRNHKLHECEEEIEEGKMPMFSYTITHSDAKLTSEQKEELEDWFKSQMTEDEE